MNYFLVCSCPSANIVATVKLAMESFFPTHSFFIKASSHTCWCLYQELKS